jgi:hypothetical protein
MHMTASCSSSWPVCLIHSAAIHRAQSGTAPGWSEALGPWSWWGPDTADPPLNAAHDGTWSFRTETTDSRALTIKFTNCCACVLSRSGLSVSILILCHYLVCCNGMEYFWVFRNKALRWILSHSTNQLTGGCREVLNKKLITRNIVSSTNFVRRSNQDGQDGWKM